MKWWRKEATLLFIFKDALSLLHSKVCIALWGTKMTCYLRKGLQLHPVWRHISDLNRWDSQTLAELEVHYLLSADPVQSTQRDPMSRTQCRAEVLFTLPMEYKGVLCAWSTFSCCFALSWRTKAGLSSNLVSLKFGRDWFKLLCGIRQGNSHWGSLKQRVYWLSPCSDISGHIG